MNPTTMVLAIDNAAHHNNRARLHAADCNALRMFKGKRGKMQITEDVAAEVEWLNDNGYPVVRCKCLGESR